MFDIEDYEKIRKMMDACEQGKCSECSYFDCESCCTQTKYEMKDLIYRMEQSLGSVAEGCVGTYETIKRAMNACCDEFGQCHCSECPYEGCEHCCQQIKHDMWLVIQSMKAMIDKK